MWDLGLISVGEKIGRAALVYLFLLGALRLFGKRQLGQLSSFDLVVLLMLASISQNAMIGPDTSVTGGLIGAITILVLNAVIARLVMRHRRFEHFVEGGPTVLVHDGHVIEANLQRELLSREELMAALRRQGVFALDDVHVALLEETGAISVMRRHPDEPPGAGVEHTHASER